MAAAAMFVFAGGVALFSAQACTQNPEKGPAVKDVKEPTSKPEPKQPEPPPEPPKPEDYPPPAT